VAIDQGLEQEFTDSAVGLAALGDYEPAINQLNQDFSTVAALYRSRAVGFSSSESGYVFINVKTSQ
jgi:hypothetical protein